jgi:hypothetical protein
MAAPWLVKAHNDPTFSTANQVTKNFPRSFDCAVCSTHDDLGLESGFSFESDEVDIAVPDANNPYNEASGHRHVGPPQSIYPRVLLASRSA